MRHYFGEFISLARAIAAKEREDCAVWVWSYGMDMYCSGRKLVDTREMGASFAKGIRARGE